MVHNRFMDEVLQHRPIASFIDANRIIFQDRMVKYNSLGVDIIYDIYNLMRSLRLAVQ
jgi:hypothetical protein